MSITTSKTTDMDTKPILLTSRLQLHMLTDFVNDAPTPEQDAAWAALTTIFEASGYEPDNSTGLTLSDIFMEAAEGARPPLQATSKQRRLLLAALDASPSMQEILENEVTLPLQCGDQTAFKQLNAKQIRLQFTEPMISAEQTAEAVKTVSQALDSAPEHIKIGSAELASQNQWSMHCQEKSFEFYDSNGDCRAEIALNPGSIKIAYFDEIGQRHRQGAPAWIDETAQYYYMNGRVHNPAGPAVILDDGHQEYYVNDKQYTDLDEWQAAAKHNPKAEDLIDFNFSFEAV